MITSALQSTKAAAPSSAALSVRVPAPDQCAAFDQQLAAQHYLGAGRPVGDYLRQIVEREGQPSASNSSPAHNIKTKDPGDLGAAARG
jgi:hypothetical protein